MKFLSFIFSFLLSLSCLSQALITDSAIILKAGIYKSFQDFKYNNPSLPLTYDYNTFYKSNSKEKVSYASLHIPLHKTQHIKTAFGFCDGIHVYLNATYKNSWLTTNTKFVRIDSLNILSTFKKANCKSNNENCTFISYYLNLIDGTKFKKTHYNFNTDSLQIQLNKSRTTLPLQTQITVQTDSFLYAKSADSLP